jgi:hypothetical protein
MVSNQIEMAYTTKKHQFKLYPLKKQSNDERETLRGEINPIKA